MNSDKTSLIIGVDPGSISGAFALLRFRDGVDPDAATVGDLPVVDKMVNAAAWASELENVMRGFPHTFAVVESVNAFPGQGVSSSFRFGQGFGIILGVLGALQIPVTLVSPAKWKKAYALDRDGEKSRALACRLYPQIAHAMSRKKDHGRAEALLLATYYAERLP
jgi:crossover junction endodeoxyribonuclease RuvC